MANLTIAQKITQEADNAQHAWELAETVMVEENKDWGTEETTVTFDDGSEIIFSCNEFKVK